MGRENGSQNGSQRGGRGAGGVSAGAADGVVVPVLAGVVTIDLDHLDEDPDGWCAVPAGVEVWVDLGDRRLVEVSYRVLDRVALLTWPARVVRVVGAHADAVGHVVGVLARGHHQHAVAERGFRRELACRADEGTRF